MRLLINYADRAFRPSQRLNSDSGVRVGGFDRAVSYGPSDIDPVFRAKNQAILSEKRGAGYWLWKPYVINQALQSVADGDFVFYSDAGSTFIRPIEPLIALAHDTGQDVLVFELHQLVEKIWTKRDAFILMGADAPRYADTFQRLASFSLWRKSPVSMSLSRELLRCAEDPRLITDLPNTMGLGNYDGFKGHRHDQSILSLLTKLHGLPAFRDPSQWGNNWKTLYPDSRYDQLIEHTRARRQSILEAVAPRVSRVSARVMRRVRSTTFWLR
jgi:hypothetical protein